MDTNLKKKQKDLTTLHFVQKQTIRIAEQPHELSNFYWSHLLQIHLQLMAAMH